MWIMFWSVLFEDRGVFCTFCGGRLALSSPDFWSWWWSLGIVGGYTCARFVMATISFATPLRLFLILSHLIAVNQMLLGGNSFLATAVLLSVSEWQKVR